MHVAGRVTVALKKGGDNDMPVERDPAAPGEHFAEHIDFQGVMASQGRVAPADHGEIHSRLFGDLAQRFRNFPVHPFRFRRREAARVGQDVKKRFFRLKRFA